jgi:hypothetical protein
MRRDRQRLHDIIEALTWVTAAAAGRTISSAATKFCVTPSRSN